MLTKRLFRKLCILTVLVTALASTEEATPTKAAAFVSCGTQCQQDYTNCVASGRDELDCRIERSYCWHACPP
jgi:hypothetical protein